MSVLTVVLSPSRDAFRSRMTRDQFRGQASRVRAELGDAGVGVFTEVKNRRETIRQVFGPFTPWKTGCGNPTVQVGGRSRSWGFTLGHKAVAGVCGARWISWQTVDFEGLKVGVVGVHPTPGGPWQRGRPLRQQARTRAIVGAWRRYRRRATTVALRLYKECDLVVVAGDINRPGGFDFVEGWTRVMPPRDLKYVAYRAKPGVRVKAGAAHLLRVPGADHQTVTVRLEVTR